MLQKGVVLYVVLVLLGSAQWANAQQEGDWLIRFSDGTTVTAEEFEYVYQKNNGGWKAARATTTEDYREYLDLFVNFKRKVIAAEAAGIDTTKAFRNELNNYLDQLAEPYLIEREVLERLVREAYEHSQQAVKVSHLLVKLPENPTPRDTLKAYRKIMAFRDSIAAGAEFEQMAEKYSEDPGGSQYAGYLSWFTAFDFIYPFEATAYNLEPGQVSQPVRTQFGYHLIKVHEKKAIKGNPRLSHILVRFGENYEAKDSAEALARIQEALSKIETPEDFAEIAREYSDDPNTRPRGGDLGTRYIGVPVLQDLRYTLTKGEVSQPVRSPFGYHIAMVTEVTPLREFDQVAAQLKNRVTRDPRAALAEKKFIRGLKEEYGFKLQEANLEAFAEAAGEAYANAGFTGEGLAEDLKARELFRFEGGSSTVQDFLTWIRNNRRRQRQKPTAESLLEQEFEAFTKAKLVDYEQTQLPRKYPEYRYLAQEYRDGILLFTLTEQEVWRKAVEDSVGLRSFWEEHKNEYTAPDRVEVFEYRSSDSTVVAEIRQLFESGEYTRPEVDSIIKAERMGARFNKQVVKRESGALADRFYTHKPGEVTEVVHQGPKYSVYYINEFRQAGVKTSEEAKAEAITAYQEHLEAEWLEELAEKYPYELNEKQFKQLFQQERN